MAAREFIDLASGLGIAGDANADAHSPRQILLASGPVLASLGIAPGDIRENVVMDERIDHFSSGQLLQLGDAVVRLTYRCEPCFRLEEVRRGLARQLLGKRGFLARVVAGGRVSRGAELSLMPMRLRAMPDDPKERLADFLSRVPAGAVVTYAQVKTVLGYASGYLRVLPVLLKSMSNRLPAHRVVGTDLHAIERHLPRQIAMLRAEGVRVGEDGAVSFESLWDTINYFDDDVAGVQLGSHQRPNGVRPQRTVTAPL